MDDARLAELRSAYAEELRGLGQITYQPVVDAFASVPREAFMGPGPWLIYGGAALTALPGKAETPDADPAHLYRNVLVALDREKRLNNGEPLFWARLFNALRPGPGERVIHVGAGTGYYTAILAHMVGPGGRVTGIEFEPDLAERARTSFADAANVEILAGDGMALAAGAADVIVASCGLDAVPLAWVKLLNEGGRLLMPLTATMPDWSGGGGGCNLMITRHGERFSAEWVGAVAIYNCMSGRTSEASERIRQALRFPTQPSDWPAWKPPAIASLRLSDKPDATAVLAGDGWWLSGVA
jgi:protein-L-isoaspartate(D-aspartate) O-methyltransferase